MSRRAAIILHSARCHDGCEWCEGRAEDVKAARDGDPGYADDYMDNVFEHAMEANWP